MNTRGTLTVQRSTNNGGNWDTVLTIDNILPSQDFGNDNIFTNIDIGSALTTGNQMIRVRASYIYEDYSNK
jgi:hypothetical protein